MSSMTLGSIDRERLVALLYGDPATHDDLITLAQIAQETGHDLDDLAPATGEPGHDPRTGITNPYAVYEPDTDVIEDEFADELGTEEPDEDALWDPAPRPGEDLEATVTRRQAAGDILDELAREFRTPVETGDEFEQLGRAA